MRCSWYEQAIIMWVQHHTEKPLWFPIRDKQKADQIVKLGRFVLRGKDYRVVGYGSEDLYAEFIRIMFPTDNWAHYKELKARVKHFKRTGEWL